MHLDQTVLLIHFSGREEHLPLRDIIARFGVQYFHQLIGRDHGDRTYSHDYQSIERWRDNYVSYTSAWSGKVFNEILTYDYAYRIEDGSGRRLCPMAIIMALYAERGDDGPLPWQEGYRYRSFRMRRFRWGSRGYSGFRGPATQNERRQASAVEEDGEPLLKARRNARSLPTAWDDVRRGSQRSWKVQRKGKKSWDR